MYLTLHRLQPEFISMALMLLAVAFPAGRVIGRAHITTLWVWAGMHKLLSAGYAVGGAQFIAGSLGLSISMALWLSPLAEVSVGILAILWRSRYAVRTNRYKS